MTHRIAFFILPQNIWLNIAYKLLKHIYKFLFQIFFYSNILKILFLVVEIAILHNSFLQVQM
jgi:hypothetical protein